MREPLSGGAVLLAFVASYLCSYLSAWLRPASDYPFLFLELSRGGRLALLEVSILARWLDLATIAIVAMTVLLTISFGTFVRRLRFATRTIGSSS